MLASMTVTPGQGIDFTALRNTLLFVAVIYILSSLFAWGQSYIMAGVTQRTVYRMRRDVDEKLSRLPLRYFDSHSRGDMLSRVTNDIDNIANSLQQTPDPADHRALHDHRRHRDHVLDQPAAGGHLAADRARCRSWSRCSSPSARSSSSPPSGRRPARSTATSRRCTPGTRSSRCSAASRRRSRPSTRENEELYQASYRAQFISGMIQPVMTFIANLNYVADLRHRRHPGRQRPDEPRRRPGVRPVLAPVHDADHPDRQHRQRHPVGGRVGRAGVRAARRGRGDAATSSCVGGAAGGRRSGRRSRTSRSATCPTCRSSRTSTSSSSRARRSPSSARPAPARPRSSTC